MNVQIVWWMGGSEMFKRQGKFANHPFVDPFILHPSQKKQVSEIVVVSIGGPKTVEIIRQSDLVLGVDKGILVKVFRCNISHCLIVSVLKQATAKKYHQDTS